jgi:hypothetical protein
VKKQPTTISVPSAPTRITAHRQRIRHSRLLDSKNATSLSRFLSENDGFVRLVIVNVDEEFQQS